MVETLSREELKGGRFVDGLTEPAAADDPPHSLDYRRPNIRARRPSDD